MDLVRLLQTRVCQHLSSTAQIVTSQMSDVVYRTSDICSIFYLGMYRTQRSKVTAYVKANFSDCI